MPVSSISPRARWAIGIVSLVGAGCVSFAARDRSGAPAPLGASPAETKGGAQAAQAASPSPLEAAPPIPCGAPDTAPRVARHDGNPGARKGAQRGLGFVAREAAEWQAKNQCYGCHVQAVTLEALSIGRHNDYAVSAAEMKTVLEGLTTIGGGSHDRRGLSLKDNDTYLDTAKEFGGAAFARYDAFAGSEVRQDLMKVAAEITEFQQPDGSVKTSHVSPPVTVGPLQATTQALQTWRQAFERSADERWLAPMRKAEAFLQARAKELAKDEVAKLAELSYAAIGLVSAGAQGSEPTLAALGQRIRKEARPDGGWALAPGQESSAFATGQSVYALRLLGASDDDPKVAAGTAWLLAHQAEDGGWSHLGSNKAEAMWAVLGLVSIDVVSVSATGITDGQHLAGRVELGARAADNTGAGVQRVEIAIDDVPVARACGSSATYSLDAGVLPTGVHMVDLVAVNAQGKKSTRRLEVYSGTHYLTQVGTRFSDGGTLISLRDVAPKGVAGDVVLKVFATRDDAGQSVRTAEVFTQTQPSAEGPMSFFWSPKAQPGVPAPHGRFIAEVTFVGEGKKAVQKVETLFVHDTLEAQQAAFGEVEGSLALDDDASAANTQVDLVDAQGRVLQSTRTTGNGSYRFRNVDRGNYKVRVRKDGFKAAEAEVVARPAAAAPAKRMKLDLL